MNKITVAYAPDVNMLPLTLVSMASILHNAKKTDEIEFVIMYSPANLPEKYLHTFGNLQGIKNYSLNMVKIDQSIFDGFPCPNWVTVEAWYRCLLADLLPDNEKVLYLDCDTIVRSSLSDLFKTDLEANLVGVIEDVSKSKDNSERIALNDNFYFISGVLLINLKAWRKADFFNKLKNIVMTDVKVTNDQDALNKTCDGLKCRLSPKYDYMHVWWRKNEHQYDEKYAKEFVKAEENPVIVHFTGVKPNNPACKIKFCHEYQEYSKLVPAYDLLQKEIGSKKTGKGREKLSLWKRIFWIEKSTDRKHWYISLLGFTFKIKCKVSQ